MVQYLTAEGGIGAEFSDEQRQDLKDENWRRVRILGDSVEAHELLDPQLAPERLLFRLYHEEGVRVFDHVGLKAHCPCSMERVQAMLQNFSSTERHDMVEESGKISVTCEFCAQHYEFSESDFKE